VPFDALSPFATVVARVCQLQPPCIVVVSGMRAKAFLDTLLQVFVGPLGAEAMVHTMPDIASEADLQTCRAHLAAKRCVLVPGKVHAMGPPLLVSNSVLRLHVVHLRDTNVPAYPWGHPAVVNALWRQANSVLHTCAHIPAGFRPSPASRGDFAEDCALLAELLQAQEAYGVHVCRKSLLTTKVNPEEVGMALASKYALYRQERGFYGSNATGVPTLPWSIVCHALAHALGAEDPSQVQDFCIRVS
jgi:hypothetical protein